MPKLTKRAIRYGRTDGPILIIEKLRFKNTKIGQGDESKF